MALYKYLSPERVDVLSNREIRITQAAALNDPFELNAYFDALVCESELVQTLFEKPLDLAPHLTKAYEKFAPEVRAKISLASFLELARTSLAGDEGKQVFLETIAKGLDVMRQITPPMRDQMTQTFRTKIGILSLSEVPDGTLMWAHYAAQHRGFVIGFNEASPFFQQQRGPEDEFYHLRRVDYRPVAAFADLRAMDGQKILAAKAPEWAYEREWRMLVPVEFAARTIFDAEGEPIHLIGFPATAVTQVVIGARMLERDRRALTEILSRPDYSHVDVRQASLDDRSGTVILRELSRQADV